MASRDIFVIGASADGVQTMTGALWKALRALERPIEHPADETEVPAGERDEA